MRHWKSRLFVFLTCFGLGLALSLLVGFIAGFFNSRNAIFTRADSQAQHTCGAGDSFSAPEEILAALKSEDVMVRREVFRRLFLRPGFATIYYDYERDRDYPERAEQAGLKYINLDEEKGDEAVITFLRYENPVALILKKESCGWSLLGALSAWLRFEDYPYVGWIEFPETVRRGTHEILLRESTGDATHYMRHARLLKLIDGALREVAEFTEESIEPVEGYHAADWSDVKLRTLTQAAFLSHEAGANIRLDTKAEVIIYSGVAPTYSYSLETDGAWHYAREHWRNRPVVHLRSVSDSARGLVWDEGQKRFVEEK